LNKKTSLFIVHRSSFIVFLLLIAASLSAADRPDLVVVISIDQFRYEYLERFAPYFAPDGFRRFLERGADFTNTYYLHANTITGPGHASIGTGYTPSESGIVGNDWFDRTTGKSVYCVADPRAAGGFSPVNLQSDSIGDRVQEKYPDARVYGVAIKDRAAILMAGRKATTAYWFEPKNGGFKSSSYYRSNTALTDSFNQTLTKTLAEHPVWEQSTFIPAADLPKLTHDPESLRKYKTNRLGLGVSFPHPVGSIEALEYTPFGNQLVLGFAERLIQTEHLGTNAKAPDLLFVGLSSPDALGHFYGPDSLEVADSCVRTDRDIAAFLQWLDARYKNRYTIAITADHGVQSIPEVAKDLGRAAGRIPLAKNGELDRLTAASLGIDAPTNLMVAFEEPSIYINWARVAELKLDGEQVKRAIRDSALKIEGVGGAFTNSELMTVNANPSPLELAVRRSFRADRSGDVLVTLKAGYIWGVATGATHGQPVEDDQHVPLLLWGRGITAKKYADRVAPTDLAKSIGFLFDVDAGGAQSRVLPAMSADDVAGAIRAALAQVSAEHLIAGKNLSVKARNAWTFETGSETLPKGYARLDRADVNGDTANVTIWTGPVPPAEPGKINMNCGTGHMFTLKRNADGAWVVMTTGIAVC
jgi:hypothetical protein